MKIKVRRVRISDIPQLVDKLHDFYQHIKERGAKDLAENDEVLRGGVTIELGTGFANPQWFCVVADRVGELVAFMIAQLEWCPPVSEHMKCVRLHASYSKDDSLVGPRTLIAMWGLVQDWGKEQGAGYVYANIHPGNQPSIKGAKYLGFKHHYTQFYRPIELEDKTEE